MVVSILGYSFVRRMKGEQMLQFEFVKIYIVWLTAACVDRVFFHRNKIVGFADDLVDEFDLSDQDMVHMYVLISGFLRASL